MIAKLRFAVLTAALILPLQAFASDPPASQSAEPQAAAPASYQGMSWPSAPPVAPAPTTHATPGNIPPPSEGKGQVVFYRKKAFKGGMISFMVRENGKDLGKLGSGDYFVATLDPGPHEFDVHSENRESLHMEVKAGETYYVSGWITMGVLIGRAHIDSADPLSFGMVFKDLTMSH